jgi:hypothetical protein
MMALRALKRYLSQQTQKRAADHAGDIGDLRVLVQCYHRTG